MNAFHVVGGLLAVWAVTVGITGIRIEGFPRSARTATLVGVISVLLALGAVGSAIGVGISEEDKGKNEGERAGPQPAGGGPGEKLQLAADPSGQLKFDKTSLEAKAGKVTIDMKNSSPVPHDISLEGGGVDQHGKQVKGGGTSTVSVDLKPGSYTFYCSVDAHRQGGMKGTLKVAG